MSDDDDSVVENGRLEGYTIQVVRRDGVGVFVRIRFDGEPCVSVDMSPADALRFFEQGREVAQKVVDAVSN